jgi:DNA (cytosine-5)-methyltransferase 1
LRNEPHAETLLCVPDVCAALTAQPYADNESQESKLVIAHTLTGEGFDASEDGTGRGTPIIPIAFDTAQITSAANRSNPRAGDPCHPLTSSGDPPAIAFETRIALSGRGKPEEVCPPLKAQSGSSGTGDGAPCIAFGWNKSSSQTLRCDSETTDALQSSGSSNPAVKQGWKCRRLMPVEAERLQAWPDNFTRYGKKPDGTVYEMADGPRYRMIGNGVTATVARYIGEGIVREIGLE